MTLPLIPVNTIVETTHDRAWLQHFSSLHDEAIKALIEANNYYEQIPTIFLSLHGKSLAQHRDHLIAAINAIDSIKFKEAVSAYQSDIYQKKITAWYVDQHHKMDTENFWAQLASYCDTNHQRDQLHSLKAIWLKQANFSFYTSQALCEVAQNYLPVFVRYLNLLSLELKTHDHQLAWGVKKQLYRYCELLKQAITNKRRHIVQAMLSRLQTASNVKDIFFDDITVACVNKLKDMKLIKESESLPRQPRRQLTETVHTYFRQYIERYGSMEQKKALDNLCWHKSDADYGVYRQGASRIVIPRVLETLVLHPSLLQRLFGEAERNREFFAKRFHLITRLRFLPKPKTEFSRLFTFHTNDKLFELFDLSEQVNVECETAEIEKPTSFWGKLFRYNKERVMTHWQDFLCRQQQFISKNVLEYASFIADQLHTRLALDLDREMLCARPFQESLRRFNEAMITLIHRSQWTVEGVSEYQKFLGQYEHVLALAKNSKIKSDRLKEENHPASTAGVTLNQTDTVSHSEVAASPIERREEPYQPDESNPFKPVTDYPSEELNVALQTLLTSAGKLRYQEAQFDSSLVQLEAFIQTFGVPTYRKGEQDSNLTDTISRLFDAYLDAWRSADETSKSSLETRLSQFESLFKSIAPESMKESISTLIDVREQECWYALHAKCYALQISYGFKQYDGEGYDEYAPTTVNVQHAVPILNDHDSKSEISSHSPAFFNKAQRSQLDDVPQQIVLSC